MQVDGFAVFHRLQIKKYSLLICISFEIFQNTGPISHSLTHVNSLLIQYVCNMNALLISAQDAILLLKCGVLGSVFPNIRNIINFNLNLENNLQIIT